MTRDVPNSHEFGYSAVMLALTHRPSPRMPECQLTFIDRAPIDFALACKQHDAYCDLLRWCGAQVQVLDVNSDHPDCVFIEDAAVALDEIVILGRMGTEARRPETDGIARELARLRPICRIEPPATLEGGDVLRAGRALLVGQSSRTNAAGIDALRRICGDYGYQVIPVAVHGCLHLKTACCALPGGRLLVNPAWINTTALADFELLTVPKEEPWGANIFCLGTTVCAAASSPHTNALIDELGFEVRTVDLSEFAKAEGGVTCLSILLPDA